MTLMFQISDNWILPVVAEQGVTRIGPLDEAGRSAIRDRLYTPGELLRLNHLTPDTNAAAGAEEEQRELLVQENA